MNRVLASLAAATLAVLTGYKLIADSGNKKNLVIMRSDCFGCRMRSGIYSHVIEMKIMVYKMYFKIENRR